MVVVPLPSCPLACPLALWPSCLPRPLPRARLKQVAARPPPGSRGRGGSVAQLLWDARGNAEADACEPGRSCGLHGASGAGVRGHLASAKTTCRVRRVRHGLVGSPSLPAFASKGQRDGAAEHTDGRSRGRRSVYPGEDLWGTNGRSEASSDRGGPLRAIRGMCLEGATPGAPSAEGQGLRHDAHFEGAGAHFEAAA